LLGATGTTALPGLLSGLAAQELVASAADPAKMVQRGLLGAGKVVGSLPSSTTRLDGTVTPIDVRSMTTGTPRDLTTTTATNRMKELGSAIQQASMTPEERQAAQVSAIAQQAGSKDVERLRKLADQLRAVGRPDAAEQYDERATKLETEAREAAAKEALTQDLINADTPEARRLAVAYAANELTYNQVLDQMEKLGIQSFNLTAADRTLYQEYAVGNPVLAADLEYLSRGEPGFLRSLFGLQGGTDDEIASYILLKAGELSERHIANEGKGKTKEEGLAWALKQLAEQKQKKEAEAIKRKQEAQTPITVPGLKPVDPNEGISEEQLNIGGA
jgi:GrpB-like predicted nucleotidyltransferase (UPF0157 family)